MSTSNIYLAIPRRLHKVAMAPDSIRKSSFCVWSIFKSRLLILQTFSSVKIVRTDKFFLHRAANLQQGYWKINQCYRVLTICLKSGCCKFYNGLSIQPLLGSNAVWRVSYKLKVILRTLVLTNPANQIKNKGLKTGVTGGRRMLTPPRRLTPYLVYPGVHVYPNLWFLFPLGVFITVLL
jgi:hypothetical protein